MQNDLEIKVCGMRDPGQIKQLAEIAIDYIGLIFYASSPRFVDQVIDHTIFGDKKKVGVFVNSPIEHILYTQSKYQLDVIQLHGHESPDMCTSIQNRGLEVIRAFSVDKNFDFSKVMEFDGYADRFIFDARGDAPGGNGVRFDWNKLREYEGATPFLLAGGISYDHLDEIKYFDHPACIGIDINSRFEKAPGDKDLITIKKFVHELRS
ncbi:MAG: phosphoribosylanthranilate isomerase [Saprospiraceae bacterium]|jgi:phosphoribosylanthranilate isomerase|nr:phosphoribosylanthranilate isomerase [Saprospiraceae bacterium]MBK7370357.1 phosphoribosylanthranilate isomerase [Saprospiraceae bacterium]MBK7438066.1 phosphoribosylanthranilate isomerase [Saprospiraceae bacterium]MBK8280696.1 phosphoribosylanthranilate isomerase [Saprospiraceae bacterium]MBK9679226.1 phosphoribosylanthranilate isomerase [Saprospiraceae bacterium]